MSGHSKWHTIKNQKAATDAKRGQMFTKLTREIIVRRVKAALVLIATIPCAWLCSVRKTAVCLGQY